jgi:hypothetical protein
MYLRIKTVYDVSSCIQYFPQDWKREVSEREENVGERKEGEGEKRRKNVPSSQPIHQPSKPHQ